MRKPVQRYMAVFEGRYEGAQVAIEAKSDKGAARLASRYERDRRGCYACRLVDLLRWDGHRFIGLPRHLVENATNWPSPKQCVGCLQRFYRHMLKAVGTDFLCPTCLDGHAVLRVELITLPIEHLGEYLMQLGASEREVAELHLPSVGLRDDAREFIA